MQGFDPGKKQFGIAPAVLLTNPKYGHNVGAALRACACFGIKQLWYTGNRVKVDDGHRLPREERFKGYRDVELRQYDKPFDQFADATPVAIEVRENAEPLPDFEHPENPVYVFGPEDGGLERVTMQHCHRVVTIPLRHCTNLAAAVYIVLYDRMAKMGVKGRLELNEDRGFEVISGYERS